MTKAQITKILTELNDEFGDGGTLYGENIWIDCKEIAVIIMITDDNIYPDDTMQIYFDSTNELIKMRTLKRKKNGTPTILIDPRLIAPYQSIVGIMMTTYAHSKSPYRRGATV